MRHLILPLVLLAACDGFDRLPYGDYRDLEPLWSDSVAVSGDSVYVPLRNGSLAWVRRGQDPESVALDGVQITTLEVLPDGTVMGRGARYTCSEDLKKSETDVNDCPFDSLETDDVAVLLDDGATSAELDIPSYYGPFTFAEDGAFGIAVLDESLLEANDGLVPLDALLVADFATGETWDVSVGFAADRILFTHDDTGATDGVVVLSQNEVAVIDLTQQVPVPDVTFPLTLDRADVVIPNDVVLTPTEDHALIAISGSRDLYALDLRDRRVNIIDLSGVPAALAVDPVTDRTLIVYRNLPYVDLLDHDNFNVERFDLPFGMDHIELTDEAALLWRTGGDQAVRFELATDRLDTYSLNFVSSDLRMSPDQTFAVSLQNTASPRMEVLDLVPDAQDRIDAQPRSYALAGFAVGLAFDERETGTSILILQQDVDTLYELDWATRQLGEIELVASPTRVGALPEGGFWITHTDALGLISFYSPGSEPVAVGGFGALGLHDQPQLAPVEE